MILFKSLDRYKLAVFLSSLSIFFGIFREFLIVGLLGFTAENDELQLYLSIFYSIGLMIDPMRLACLNLYSELSLPKMLAAATIISLPFVIVVGCLMSYATHHIDWQILWITLGGSYLNLMAALLITFKQRHNIFLKAQLINVMPNFVLIPGIIICYQLARDQVVLAMVSFTSIIPIIQCVLLLSLSNRDQQRIQKNSITFWASLVIFIRHFAAMIGEQLFQVIIRAAFYNYRTGFLSVYAMMIRIYAALRFILIDSFIGSKLANWDLLKNEPPLATLLKSKSIALGIILITLTICLHPFHQLLYSALQMVLILCFGFYFSTLVRILYFKINRHEINPTIIWQFAFYEIVCALGAFLLTNHFNYSILSILWLGYVAKPFAQLLLLRKRFYGLLASS